MSRLRKALKQEQLRADAFDAMIDDAEAKFNIPIRKKKPAPNSDQPACKVREGLSD